VKSDKRGYISITLKLGLIYKDLEMLKSIKDVLKIGRIAGPYKNIKGQETIYLIFNKTELQQVLFPLLIFHNIYFLTPERIKQYKKALYYMESGEVKFQDDLEIFKSNSDSIEPLKLNNSVQSFSFYKSIFKKPNYPEIASDYLEFPFFKS
jgi:hypothetical protein